MKTEKLAGLQPERVFAYFEKICSIPHGSRNTKAISDYLVSFAKEHDLRYIQDDTNNVIIFKPAAPGYEDREPVILQGHMDMVCQKDEGVTIDMETQPVDVTYNEEFVYAKGTTLGADDGIAVAFCLAILEDKSLAHPALEVVITSDEEIGLIGANAIDLSMLKGRRMLNMDSTKDYIFNVGCGGGARVSMELPVSRESYSGACLRLTLEGLKGGHSGSMIGTGCVNANKAMVELLSRFEDLRLVSIQGGTAGNVIPNACQAMVVTENVAAAEDICREFLMQLRETESNAVLMPSLVENWEGEVLDGQSTQKVLNFLQEIPNEVQQWSPDFEKLPLTSLNLGVVQLESHKPLYILTALRSGVNADRQALQDRLKVLAQQHGSSYSESGVYSAWEYRKDSPLRNTIVEVYKQRRGEDPVVRVIHAGLECGVLSEKLPGLDCVSMGPNSYDIHTTRERLEIVSAQRTWEFVLEVLSKL